VTARIGSTASASVLAGNLWQGGEKMAAQIGFLRWDSIPRLACRGTAGIGAADRSLIDVPSLGDGAAAAEELDVAVLSWTSWDMIQNVRRADQAHSGITDATRTAGGFHAHRNGEAAGQWP